MQQLNTLFIKDKKLPIHLEKSPYFEYFMQLYDPWLNTYAQYDLLMKDFNRFENFDKWYINKEQVTKNIKDFILKSQAYSELNSESIDQKYLIKDNYKFPSGNVFNKEHVNKNLLSIDMVKANWQMWNLLGLTDNKGYEEFIKQFQASDYQASSKILRQVLFGEIHPKRIQKMEKYFTHKVASALQKSNFKLLTCTADEMVVELKEGDNVDKIQSIVKQETPQINWRIEYWQLENILEERHWILQKNISNGQINFRNVPKHFMAQVYKHHMQLPLHENDLLFEHEGIMAKFSSALNFEVKKRFTPR